MKKIILGLVIAAGMGVGIGFSQTNQITLNAPAPYPVVGGTASIIGNGGSAQYYYWVIAKYPRGNAVPFGPIVAMGVADVLSGGRYVQLNWNPTVGATGYDVVRNTIPTLPTTGNNAVVLNTSAYTVNDDGSALSAYTVTSAGPVVGNIVLDASTYAQVRYVFDQAIKLPTGGIWFGDGTHQITAASAGIGYPPAGLALSNGSGWLTNSTIYVNGANVGIGTTIPGANKLAIGGTAATDSAPLSAELVDGTGWTSTGWTGTLPFTHTPGNTTPLSRAITGMANNTYWQVVLTISGSTTGYVTMSIGGTTVDDYTGIFARNTSWTRGPKAVSAASLVITPTSDFDGVVSISVKQISPITANAFATFDSTGAVSYSVLQQSASLNNIYIGGGGLYNTTGSNNTNNGALAGYSNTTGSNNTNNGFQAGYSNTTGPYNTNNGALAGYSNTTGYNNTNNGFQAGYSNTTGYQNTNNGVLAGYSNTTGFYNTNNGAQAGFSNTTGFYNTNNGALAGYSNTTGYQNTNNGFQAGLSNTTGYNNTNNGVQAGYTETSTNANVSGSQNTWVGYQSGPGTATQLDNTIGIGYRSHPMVSNQTVIGNSSTTLTNIFGATMVGKGIGELTCSGTFCVQDATATTGVTSVKVIEGAGQSTGEVFGVYANNEVTPRMVVMNGNILIGTTVDNGAKLQVNGSIQMIPPTSCTAQPTNTIAVIAGVFTLCP